MPVLSTVGAMAARGFGWLFKAAGGGGSKLYAWGNNAYGQLGQGNTTNRSSPVQIGSVADWANGVSLGDIATLAIKSTGSLWSIGYNGQGQLGLGDTTSRSSPVQVGALTTWASIISGAQESYNAGAIKTDGTLWTWGNNDNGQLGLGNTTNRSSPVQVGADTNWDTVWAGAWFMLARKTNGTIWSWGGYFDGALGQGSSPVSRSSPVQIGALTDWSSVSAGRNFSGGITTSGTLWMWGGNAYGQLGQEDTTNYSSPVQVGALTDWSKISTGYSHCLAVKTNGTLWAWGQNNQGQLGLGDTVNRSSPVQVGALTTWAIQCAGYVASFVIKTDGTLWAWGYNGFGMLGIGNTTARSSPVQVGSNTNWLAVSSGSDHTVALTS